MFCTYFSSPVTDEGNCVFSKHKNGTARIVETMSSWHNAGRSIVKRPKRSPNVRLILPYKYDPHIDIIKIFLMVVDP